MIAIVDSGSTKADWHVLHKNGDIESESTTGFNPFFQDTQYIFNSLSQQLNGAHWMSQLTEVHYYGAGCSDDFRCEIVAEALRSLFPQASVHVEHDILASARATCGAKPGIACILGTGSNSCLYDGNKLIDNVTNLGYLLGDEGSGGHLGKKLLQGYFYRELPEDIKYDFETNFSIKGREFLNEVYGHEKPNVYLASFAKFISNHKEHFYIQNMVNQTFGEFLDRHVRKYQGHSNLPVHFVGSVAFHFKDILRIAMRERNLKMGIVIKKPINNLAQYHLLGDQFVPAEQN
ncbi:MAG: glucosamine kinase [Polaribacter sp.]|jgi:glucosamine kinase